MHIRIVQILANIISSQTSRLSISNRDATHIGIRTGNCREVEDCRLTICRRHIGQSSYWMVVISSGGTLVGKWSRDGRVRVCIRWGKLTIWWIRSRHVITLRSMDVDGRVRWRATWQITSARWWRGRHSRCLGAVGVRSSRRTWRLRARARLWWRSRTWCVMRGMCWRDGRGSSAWRTRVRRRVWYTLCISGLTFALASLARTSILEPDLEKNKTQQINY